MPLQDSLRKNLTPELYTQVIDQLGDDFDFDLVPRARLNKVIAQRNELRKQLTGVSQPQVEETVEADTVDTGAPDINAIKAQYEAQQAQAIKEVKIQYAALDMLRAANIIDPDLVWSSNAIDKTKLSIDDSGNLTGMDDVLAQLKSTKAHLFKVEEPPVPKGTGKDGEDVFEGVTSKKAFLELPMDKQLAFKQANPEVFKTFMSNK